MASSRGRRYLASKIQGGGQPTGSSNISETTEDIIKITTATTMFSGSTFLLLVLLISTCRKSKMAAKLRKSCQVGDIIFVKLRTRTSMPKLPSVISGFTLVESIKILGWRSPVNFPSQSMTTISWPHVPSYYLLYVLSDNMDYRMTHYVQCSRRLSPTNLVMYLQPGGGSPPPTNVIAWKHCYSANSSATV